MQCTMKMDTKSICNLEATVKSKTEDLLGIFGQEIPKNTSICEALSQITNSIRVVDDQGDIN